MNLDIPEELSKYIINDGKQTTPFVAGDLLSDVFEEMIKDYFLREGRFTDLKQTRQNFLFFEEAINDSKVQIDFLIKLAFPHTNKDWSKNKYALLTLYKYLDKYFSNKGLKNGKGWIEEIKNRPKHKPKKIKSNISFKGAIIIDEDFKKSKNLLRFTKEDFFLGKDSEDRQWSGVINDLVIPINKHDIIKTNLLSAFDHDNRVCSVIYGTGGNGKSTTLRKLAIDCIESDYTLLWLTDIKNFYEQDLEIIQLATSEKYILFIEDWFGLESDLLLPALFNRAVKTENLRITIADREIIGKPYNKHVMEDNRFLLSSKENERIITKIAEEHLNINLLEQSIASEEFYNAPLYVILFVLIRTHQKDRALSVNFSSQFSEIIQNDLKIINEIYPGLALALHYYSCMRSKGMRGITWGALLKIADFYNGGNNLISNRLLIPDKESSLFKTISGYLSFKSFYSLSYMNDMIRVSFHHDLLVEKGLVIPLTREWHPFDKSIEQEIGRILIKEKQLFSASSVIGSTYGKETNPSEEHFKQVADLQNLNYEYFKDLLKEIFSNPKETNQSHWINVIGHFCQVYGPSDVAGLCSQLVLIGCKDKTIVSLALIAKTDLKEYNIMLNRILNIINKHAMET
jgi:hypothetical protein